MKEFAYVLENNPLVYVILYTISIGITAWVIIHMIRFIETFLRFLTIQKHGYPPKHCDVDGLVFYDEDDR